MDKAVQEENTQPHKEKVQTLAHETWIKQLLVRVGELEKIIPEYKSNIDRHNQSLDKTSKKVKDAASGNNQKNGSAFIFAPKNQLTRLYEQVTSLLLVVGDGDDQGQFLNHVSEYASLKSKLEELGGTTVRVVTNESLEKAFQFFEEAITYYEEYELALDLLKTIERILNQHHQLIAELKVFYQVQSEVDQDKPNPHKLLEDMGRMKKRYPEHEASYLERIKQKLPPHIAEELVERLELKLEQLSVGYYEFYLDQLYANASLPNAVNPKIGELFQAIQNKLSKAKNMHHVWVASKELPMGIEKLYVLHWVYESLFKTAWQDDSKRALFCSPRDQKPPMLGKAVKGFMKFGAHLLKPEESNALDHFLVDGVFFRNRVAHQGIIFAPEVFSKAISAYKSGGVICSAKLGVSLSDVPKKEDIQIDLEKAKNTLGGFLKYKAVGDPSEEFRPTNGWKDKPETWLSMEDIMNNPVLKESLYNYELAISYGLEGKDVGRKFSMQFEQILADHFCQLFLGRRMSINQMKNAYRSGLVKKGLLKEGEKMLPGFLRALYMVGKVTEVDNPLLNNKSYYFKDQDTPTVKEVGEIIQRELQSHSKSSH